MRASLSRWIGDADALRHLQDFQVAAPALDVAHIRARSSDYYIALVGELFERMRVDNGIAAEWARLGNALSQFGAPDREALFPHAEVLAAEALLFAAAAFYCGGFPASAYLTMRYRRPQPADEGVTAACVDLIGRPPTMTSAVGTSLLEALRNGDMPRLRAIYEAAVVQSAAALAIGPDAWVPARLLEKLLDRFQRTNLRAVLPNGGDGFWTALVTSFVDRSVWEFFPSQILAIDRGLLGAAGTFSLQMPTGAGKTALCETLLYRHARTNPAAAAVLLVPYRSLASELRGTVVKRLNEMGIASTCVYGGTVPSGNEIQGLDTVQVVVATPEALSGLLSAERGFFRRISLAICDEGHLLDGGARGVSLELLLARMRSREGGAPRLVFVSAIVPNIEEINLWLGGTNDSVVRSDYRPALAEFSVLRPSGQGADFTIALEMHPHEDTPPRFAIPAFLRREDFRWLNPQTGRINTYPFTSFKAQAIAAARKSLAMGAVAVFAANKRGDQGAVGLAEELLQQLQHELPLPSPFAFVDRERLGAAIQHLELEYGTGWIGTRALQNGAVLHHGDVPQESREVVEALLRHGDVRLAICTTTLAEGVNLPIRTIVLYSVQRRRSTGRADNLLARDIKNLVGRAGRAGATTKGLVICVNAGQWGVVEPVARQAPGEPVTGALRKLVAALPGALAVRNEALTNALLESRADLHALIDGVDATVIDLATEEIGEEELVLLATQLADQTFASRQATLRESRTLLQRVFELRARRVIGIRTAGRLPWVKETGARVRMLDSVEVDLFPRRTSWHDVDDAMDPALVSIMLGWAWNQPELTMAVREAYRLADGAATDHIRLAFFEIVSMWLSGRPFAEIAALANLSVDDLLGIHTHAVTFVLQTLVEQAVALLDRLVQAQGRQLSDAVTHFADHLRFGVPTVGARTLAARGLRHRRAAVELGAILSRAVVDNRDALFPAARRILEDDRLEWRRRLGRLVFDRTLQDLT